MTATVTDLFCGAGGSSVGAEASGMRLVSAANHWQTAIDVHQVHFPEARHDVADISQADPRRYPATDVLIASPECTNHSQSRGVSRKRQDPSLWDAPDPAAERSRATMWDVGRFAEQVRYSAIVVENVVEATKWTGWPHWLAWLTDLGYEHRILSHNSMHHGVPQSRDRIYVVFWRRGLKPDLELELEAWCPNCEATRVVRQAWKPGRTVGRYRQQWTWQCVTCAGTCEPAARPAADIIDWDLPCPRIGDRPRPLAAKTRARILAGLERYGWAPVVTTGAGHGFERTPGNRARPLTDPLPAQGTTAQHAMATPPDPGDSLAVHMRGTSADHITGTATAGGRHALLMRNNTPRGNAGQMVTPVTEPARTMTTTGHQSLVLPYYGRCEAQPATRPLPTVRTRDAAALVDPDALVDDCGFRMLEPHEIAAAMAFPDGYIPTTYTKKDRVRLAGNAVTPPVMNWICGRLLQALAAAA